MQRHNRWVWITSIALVLLGALSFVINVVLGYAIDFGWPLLVIVLGVVFCLLAVGYTGEYGWANYLFLPGGLLAALGLIFLLNALTGDWSAWAYAWLLALAGLGVGILLAARRQTLPQWVSLLGLGLALGGLTLAVLFGAIMGGLFIQVMAPLALVLAGISLRWLKPQRFLPQGWFRRSGSAGSSDEAAQPPDQSQLIEPLSVREMEVLALIAQGLSNAEIAHKLTLAQSTVKTHINNIYGKLGVQTRIAAIQRAQALRLI